MMKMNELTKIIIDCAVEVVECKATEQMEKIFQSQLLTYLRLSGLRVGLLLNFGQILMKNGIYRVINGF
jgi:GxxExxY protein